MSDPCPFCSPTGQTVLFESPLVFAIADGFPVSAGHCLVVPREHVRTYFDATSEQQAALWEAVAAVKAHLDSTLVPTPDGYNVGFNVDEAAGQTIDHAHIHVIPRYRGDVPNPRGGVRWVIPYKADSTMDLESNTPQDVVDVTPGPSRPLAPWLLSDLSSATRIEIAVAFVWKKGLQKILPRLAECLERGGTVRFLTGDYECLTAPDALRLLLDLADEFEQFECKVFETDRTGGSFHPKAYLLSSGDNEAKSVAYVGSSNLSVRALESGEEWNIRVQAVAGIRRARAAFDELFGHHAAAGITHDWVDAYEKRHEQFRKKRGKSDVFVFGEPPNEPFTPHPIQQEALDALAETRAHGNRAGLVVLATGLGKTWLAAFDSTQYQRVLFVAHRKEILEQSLHTFRAVRPKDRFGLYTGDSKHPRANVLFAGIQTLSRPQHRALFAPEHFDYIVVDEFHHASAKTYRELIRYFRPKFLLGLTATPDRSDGDDLLSLCDQNLVYRCDLGRGIAEDRLCPFHYHGIPDLVDYANIPWRSRKFDEQKLSEAVETQERALNALEQWRKHGGPNSRTIGFCVSQRHADFMRRFFQDAGVLAAAVHSGSSSDSREDSLSQLQDGELDVLFAVDMFNEGLDIKNIDTVLMLRPTESRILWLQQLGRGLRKHPDKERLQVIDYIGNHRVFLQKPAALLNAFGIDLSRPRDILQALRTKEFEDHLPPGCEVTYELETIELLESLFPPSKGVGSVVDWYDAFEQNNGIRPTALQAHRAGRDPRTMARVFGSWLRFVQSKGGLNDAAELALDRNSELLRELETMAITDGLEVFVLEAMMWRDSLPGTVMLDDLVHAIIEINDRSSARRSAIMANLSDPPSVKALLLDGPVITWTTHATPEGLPYFEFEGDEFRSGPGINAGDTEDQRLALIDLVAELIEWRVVRYLEERRKRVRLRLDHDESDQPVLKLDRKKHDLPATDTWALVEIQGQHYRANFQQEFIKVVVAAEDDAEENVLPALVQDWFGDHADPGTSVSVTQGVAPTGGYRWWPTRAGAGDHKSPEGAFIHDKDGTPVDSRMMVEELHDGAVTVVVMSRGGGRNDRYAQGVELLLDRLGARGVAIEKIAVESGGTKTLSLDGRTIGVQDHEYPIELSTIDDTKALRIAIGRAGAALGRAKDAKPGGGNMNKRIRLWLSGVELDDLEHLLADA